MDVYRKMLQAMVPGAGNLIVGLIYDHKMNGMGIDVLDGTRDDRIVRHVEYGAPCLRLTDEAFAAYIKTYAVSIDEDDLSSRTICSTNGAAMFDVLAVECRRYVEFLCRARTLFQENPQRTFLIFLDEKNHAHLHFP